MPWRNAKVYFYFVNKQLLTIIVNLVAISSIQVLCLFCMISDAISLFQSGFTLTTRDEADFVHFNCFFLFHFPGHQVPTPTSSSSKNISHVIAINRDYGIMESFLFYETNLGNSSKKLRLMPSFVVISLLQILFGI